MNIVTLPVHPLSKRILLCEYGQEPIVLSRHDLLWEAFRSDPENVSSALNEAKGTLSTTITIQLNSGMVRRLAKQGALSFRIGIHIHRVHLQKMYSYVEAFVRLGEDASEGIADFLSKYEVAEDEMAAETAYRYWHRYQQRKNKKKVVKNGQSGRNESAAKVPIFARIKTEPDESQSRKLQQALRDFAQAYEKWYQTARSRRQKNKRGGKLVLKHITVYTLYKVGRYSASEVGEKVGIHPRTVHKCLHSAEGWCNTYPTVKRLFQQALNQNGLECPIQ